MNKSTNCQTSLAQLVTRGGIYYQISGGSRQEIIANIIEKLKDKLPPRKNDVLLQAIMEREALISTGIENGIALPHPRTPMLEENEEPFVTIAFPLDPPDWETPDNSKAHTVFLIVSESPKQHLHALTKINFLCMQEKFYNLISSRAPKAEIIAAIEEAEKGWQNTN
ncbi:MAG: PTS sugar transporter subunit IIA [Treponema sp.]|nr:PTS sugar transporter subunit IIA [Treponema sp.]